MSDKKAVAFRFDADIAELLVQAASDAHLSQVDVLQQAIREYASRQRSLQNAIHGVTDESATLQNAIQDDEPHPGYHFETSEHTLPYNGQRLPVMFEVPDSSPAVDALQMHPPRRAPTFAEQMEAAKAAGHRPR